MLRMSLITLILQFKKRFSWFTGLANKVAYGYQYLSADTVERAYRNEFVCRRDALRALQISQNYLGFFTLAKT